MNNPRWALYKLLLCWRYLRTRYLAMVCIVSGMAGGATLIVGNSVMARFSTKLRDRLHALLSDVELGAGTYGGFGNPGDKMARIRSDPFLNERVAAMTPTLEIFAMVQFRYRDEPIAHPIRLVGIDLEGRKRIGGFEEYLVREGGHRPSFELSPEAKARYAENLRRRRPLFNAFAVPAGPDGRPAPEPPPEEPDVPRGILL